MPTNRIFDFGRRVVTTASTLFGRPWGIPRPQDGTGTAPLAPSPALNPVGPNPPYTPPFQLRDDPPPQANPLQQQEEYAAAQVGLAAYYRSLPPWIDDLTRGLGDDLYARMGLDDQIFSSTRNLARQVLADGLTLRPAIEDKDDPDYETAADYCDRAERMLSDLSAGLPQSMDVILQEALQIGMGMGHKVFELVYEPSDEDGWTNLARIKSKPRRSTAFVVNPYNDLVGMLVRLPGMALPALASVTDLRSMPILPLDKFAVFTHFMEDADPRGNSLWRAAYAQWWEKIQTARDYMRYLGQFAMPSVMGELPEMSTDEPATDQFGNVVPNAAPVSQAQAMLNMLMAWRNGSAGVHGHGAKVYTVFAASTGEAFWAKLDRCDRQIDKVITGQVLAGQESLHGTRAQAETHQDTAGGNLPYYRGLLEELLNRQVLCRWLRLNVGDAEARRLAPKATLKKVEEQDRGEAMTSYGALYQSGVLKPSQLPYVHEQLGLPPADPEELTSEHDEAMALQTVKGEQDAARAKEAQQAKDAQAKDAEMAQGAGEPDLSLFRAVLAILPRERPAVLPHRCGEAAGAVVWLVDGNAVKLRRRPGGTNAKGDADFMEFVEGGNGQEDHDLCGPDEVYIDALIDPISWAYIGYHEVKERADMEGGESYDRAHADASAHEKALREHYPDPWSAVGQVVEMAKPSQPEPPVLHRKVQKIKRDHQGGLAEVDTVEGDVPLSWLAAFSAEFSDQPRVPAGTPEGGRWTDGTIHPDKAFSTAVELRKKDPQGVAGVMVNVLSDKPRLIKLPRPDATPGQRIARFKAAADEVERWRYYGEVMAEPHAATVAAGHPHGGATLQHAREQARQHYETTLANAKAHLAALPDDLREKGERHLARAEDKS